MSPSKYANHGLYFLKRLKRGCSLGAKVLYLKCCFEVTVRVMGKSGGTLILHVGLTRRTHAEPSCEKHAPGWEGRGRRIQSSVGTGTQAAEYVYEGCGQFAPSVKLHFGEPKCTGGS